MDCFRVDLMAKNYDLKTEDQLLLSCARTKLEDENTNKINTLLDSNLNWNYILDKAYVNGLMPILYYNLNRTAPEKIPHDILEKLKTNFYENAHRNLLLTAELVKVMHILEKKGVKAVTHKGPVLAHTAYGNIAYRAFDDIDILIQRSDANKAKKIMIENGYSFDQPIEVKTSTYVKLASEYQFKSHSGATIEINWSFVGSYFYFPTNPKLLFNDLKLLKINGSEIKTFSPDNEFLMLCIHCSKHNWQRLSWICDLGEVLENKTINWSEVWKKADQLAVKRIVLVNLFLLKYLFGFEFSHEIEKIQDKDAQELACHIIRRKFGDGEDLWNTLEKFFLYTKKRETLVYGVMDCLGGLTKPIYQDYQIIKLPESLFVLYSIIRPFLLLRKFLKTQI